MACSRNCYFLDKLYVESDPEESADDSEDDDGEIEDNDNESNKLNLHNKCAYCNFQAKNITGLKMHEKSTHKIKCFSCDFKTTTKILLKKHMQDLH